MFGYLSRPLGSGRLATAALALAFGLAASADDKKEDEKPPSIKELMKQGHGKGDGHLDKIATALKGKKWEDAEPEAKSLELVAGALAKNTPPKGAAKSWEKLTGKYSDNVKALAAAVEKKEAKGANAALSAIKNSCGGCHSAHKK